MAVRPDEIASIIKQQIEQFGGAVTAVDVGSVVESGDGIARIYGLRNCQYSELLEFRTKDQSGGQHTVMGLALNLEEDTVGAIILGDYTEIKEGDEVRSTGRIIQVPVGDGLIGRVVDPLGQPLDGKGPVPSTKSLPVEKIAPGVAERQAVNQSLHTGVKAIDAMVPIGRGQRELIIGDRFTGKTAICLDAIIAQKNSGVICIYVGIGQQASKIAQVIGILEENGAMGHT
ncbi:MAG: F0F1 ATP synthase subunit alpha, partial [Chloroflexota bacterium]